ncbi:hypothetical protein M413DRAFT_438773, partial [Hebeloma cylindrosporum]
MTGFAKTANCWGIAQTFGTLMAHGQTKKREKNTYCLACSLISRRYWLCKWQPRGSSAAASWLSTEESLGS